jgi:hypothetical protein
MIDPVLAFAKALLIVDVLDGFPSDPMTVLVLHREQVVVEPLMEHSVKSVLGKVPFES